MSGRQIVLDTETTGLNAALGDRVIEIGCVEVLNRRITDRSFHSYVNPEREIEEGAAKVHGIDREYLADKPKFAAIAPEFLEYVRGAELVIHNAEFDVDFLDRELALAGFGKLREYVSGVVDTLALARDLHPAKKNNLDALCERYAIANSHRTLHGALLDARLLAEVYLAMTRGQETLAMELEAPAAAIAVAAAGIDVSLLIVLRATPDELAAHERYLDAIDRESNGGALWRKEQLAIN
jgi:DNA polymerase-3 subunit epsilon